MPKLILRVGLLGGSILFALVFVEGAARLREGYPLLSFRPLDRASVTSSPKKAWAGEITLALVAQAAKFPVGSDIDSSWFQVNPPDVPRRPVDPVLRARYQDFERRGVYGPQSFYIWNTELVKAACSSKADVFRNFPPDVKAFATSDRSPHPAYRFPANETLPSGLVTNQFGFRGPALAEQKDARLIRIAFIGASTTQNVAEYRWSYPELVGSWLNLWLRNQHRPERVEIINAGREGVNSADIREIVKRELLPLQPDYVVYYEGANLVGVPSVHWPGGKAPPRPADVGRRGVVASWFLDHSAFARIMDPLVLRALVRTLDEPRRPHYELDLPSPERATRVQLREALGTFLDTITTDLDEDRRALDEVGARLVVSSVIRLVHDGLRLDPVAQAATYKQLNTLFQPLSYADIRRLVDLQNAAYRTYAADRGIDFIDVAKDFPRDANLFFDSFHLTERGVRLHAWLAFLMLAQILKRDAGPLSARPVPPAISLSTPTAFDAQLPSCTAPPDSARVSVPLDLSLLKEGTGGHVRSGKNVEVVTPAQSWSYGAILTIALPQDRSSPVWIEVTLKVAHGTVGVGLLNAGQEDFVGRQSVADTDGLRTISFRIAPDENVTSLIVETWADPVSAEAEIDAVTLVRERR